VEERIFKTLSLDRTLRAHALREFDTKTVRGKEPTPIDISTPSLEHPLVLITELFHDHLWLDPRRGSLIRWCT